ncbi:RrF2 family transcriptional regulator [Spirochaeta cellobiosiphila]|uniref:RrF2 family transcriptional regulator n=1 Tax=Spirochaeta cellobiosiphila TaxID=504483 RepID=UPI0004136AEB|nr:Rrf2 family transcriptional regulator [Spirochaeta cellobiosiphila]
MRVTTKGRYALRAVVNLAVNYKDKPISIRTIAEEEKLSPEFLEQIFFRLKKSGIISSVRGPGGGFKMDRDKSEISIKDVFDAVGEGLDLTPCVACQEKNMSTCENSDDCLTYDIWANATDQITSYFANISIEDILVKQKDKIIKALSTGDDFEIK